MRRLVILIAALILGACAGAAEDVELPATDLDIQGARLLAEGKPKEALEVFRSSAYDGRSYRGMVGMAYCYAYLGDEARFETLAMEAAGRSPRTLESHHRLGVLFVKGAERFRMYPASQRFAQVGVEYLRRVYASIRDDDPDLLPTLGLGLHLADMDDSAAIILNDALLRQPKRVDVIHTLVSVYRRQGDRARTKELLEPWHDRDEIPPVWVEAWTWANEVPVLSGR